MREIKFRAFVNGKMYHWGSGVISIDHQLNIETVGREYLPTKSILMQYTGLTDKNGKEIYEGDTDNKKMVCQYFPKLGAFGFKHQNYSAVTFLGQWVDNGGEVIGNIYDNPELLTK
jgi:hypothetical protein